MELSTKLGDTSELARYQLLDRSGQPVNLTGASVVQRFSGAPAAGSPCDIDGDPVDGIVRLSTREHLPTVSPGGYTTFKFETEVTYSDGVVQTFPTEGYDDWKVWSDLDI